MKVSCEAKILLPEIPVVRNERKLLAELVLCILSSQEKYEVALAMIKRLKSENILRIPQNKADLIIIKGELDNALKNAVHFMLNDKEYSRRLRFFSKKSNYVVDTLEAIYLNNLTIRKILDQEGSIYEIRRNIINYSHGLGPKQASMFLRNIGYHSDFAILDKHVIDYMKIMGLTYEGASHFTKMSNYQRVETQLKSYAHAYNVSMFHLDLAIWTTMRTLKQ